MEVNNTLKPDRNFNAKLRPGCYPHVGFWKLVQQMANRMAISQQKYGDIEEVPRIGTDVLGSLEQRLEKYRTTGNIEWLLDVANLALIEALTSQHPKVHFRATDSDESPGLVGRPGTAGENA